MIDNKKHCAILGCGAIFSRHLEAIKSNENFNLVAICDIHKELVDNLSKKHGVEGYTNYKDLIKHKDLNFVSINTPNSLHPKHAKFFIKNNCDVLIEKPVSLNPKDVHEIWNLALSHERTAYCVLQVRLNPAIKLIKQTLEKDLLGNVRGVSLVQRWQRPIEYFNGWRGISDVGGGTLHECGIHYLDILCYLLGKPEVLASKSYKTKHLESDIEDTVYSILDFGDFGGSLEVTIAAEPINLECSLSILGSNGFIKIGGKAMNVIESYNFLSNGCRIEFENMLRDQEIPNRPNSYGSHLGSCPNHAELYKNINDFTIDQSIFSISLIDEIYKKSNISYY